MASVKKTNEGTWAVRWRQLNGQQKMKTFRRRVDADAHQTEVEAKAAD